MGLVVDFLAAEVVVFGEYLLVDFKNLLEFRRDHFL